jgi:Uncharacterized protein conserved in bacteria
MADHSLIFYDGGCGLCHRAVRFAIAHDPEGARFRFASLDSDGFRRRVPAAARAGLPDSIVALTPDGALLVRSAAVIHVLERVGGAWGFWGRLLRLVPRWVRDTGYEVWPDCATCSSGGPTMPAPSPRPSYGRASRADAV